MKKLACLVLAVLMAVSVFAVASAEAEWKWERKIDIVCPWGVGGGADSTIRPMSNLLSSILGVPVEVVNVEGAGGVNGVEYTYTRQLPADPMQRALWYVLATTGMRRGEACGLQWRDLDEDGLLSIRRARVDAGGRVVESAPKTRRGRRRIALDAATLEVLDEWHRAQRRQRLQYGKVWEDQADHVFTHAVYFAKPPRYGAVIMPNWITAAFRRLRATSDLPPLHLHGLRHSWSTAALEAGEHLRAVADHLGHADVGITDRIYTHTVRRVQDVTALRVAELITSKRGGGEGQ